LTLLRWTGQIAFALARKMALSSVGGWFIRFGLTHMSFLLPVERLHETDSLIAFHHPKPSHPLHILLIPRRAIANLTELTPDDSDFYLDLFAVTAQLAAQFGLERCGYSLITNGGPYQDIPHLHFHLIAPEYSG
jgi:histidine triad (HIT) family protein